METKVLSKPNAILEKHYSSKENINVLLKAMELDDYEFGGIKNTYTINDNRFAFGMFVKNKDNGKLLSIYVDTIMGYPSWDQCMDATFNLGQDYDKRVIMFCDDKIDPRSMDELNNLDVVENFVETINNSDLETYFIQAQGLDNNDSEVPLDYFVLVNPKDNESVSFKALPSKTDFHWARFNIIFCAFMNMGRHLYLEPEEWMNPYGYGCHLKVEKVWNENGGFLNAVLDSDKQSDLDILNKYYAELRIRIPDYSIEFISKDDKVKGVSVRILDNPFSEFVLDLDNAEGLVEEFQSHEFGFTSLVDDVSGGDRNRENWEPFYFVDHK
jgi:hypothetical protein